MPNTAPVVKCDTPADVFLAAATWLHAGFCVVPAAPGKRPGLDSWREYQQRLPTDAELEAWFTPTTTGLGLVCGAVSGGLEMLELEGRVVEQARKVLPAALKAAGLIGVWERIRDGYCETTPGGGIHFLYRISDAPVPGNEKVARGSDGAVLVETRGEGGFVVVAPSHGATHPTGKPWVFCNDSYAGQVPTVTWEERVELHRAMAAVLDSSPEPAPFTGSGGGTAVANGTRPGDRWAAATDWGQVLVPHGWRWVYRQGDMDFWRRPGKNVGVSARTGGTHDGFWAWSTSVLQFGPETLYTKYAVHTLLNHGGDFDAATRALPSQFRGSPASAPVVPADPWIPNPVSAANGNGHHPVEAEKNPPEYTQDHIGISRRFISQHHGTTRWVMADKSHWAAYDGIKWNFSGASTMAKSAMTLTVERLEDEAGSYDDNRPVNQRGTESPSDRDRFLKFAKASRSDANIKGSLSVAEGGSEIRVTRDEFDKKRDLLNLPNTVMNLESGETTPHDPLHYLTKVFGASYDPAATCPNWSRYLEMNVPDPEVRSYLQRAAGYALTGRSNEKKMFYLYGGKDTGKTIFAEVLAALFGDYGITAADGALRPKRNQGGPSNDINDMRGARFVTTSETRPGQEMDEALVKRITGGDTQRSRGLYQENRAWTPECVLLVASNQYPRITGDDDAIWDRIRVVKFSRAFPEGDPDRDPMLKDKIKGNELSGVFNWALAGLADYLANGLNEPDAVSGWSEEFRSEQDGVARFVDDLTESGVLTKSPNESANRAELYNRYRQWADGEGLSPLSARRFHPRMAALGYPSYRSDAARVITGLRINREATGQWVASGNYYPRQ